jgi:hypothetical protein
MAVKDLSSYLDDDALEIPIDGKTYRVESPDAKTGLFLASLANIGVNAASGGQVTEADLEKLDLDDVAERDFMKMVLGDTLDELIFDGVKWTKIQRLSRYCFIAFAIGEEAADEALKNGTLSGEAPAPNRAARRGASRGGATKTPRQVSTAGTTSTKAPARKPRARA